MVALSPLKEEDRKENDRNNSDDHVFRKVSVELKRIGNSDVSIAPLLVKIVILLVIPVPPGVYASVAAGQVT